MEENGEIDFLKSSETLKNIVKDGEIHPVLLAEDGEILDGKHRLLQKPTWHSITVPVKTKKEKILIRMHANIRRKVPVEERRKEFLELAQELEKTGVPKHNISAELGKLTPFTSAYVRLLLPEEYKDITKRTKASVDAQIVSDKPRVTFQPEKKPEYKVTFKPTERKPDPMSNFTLTSIDIASPLADALHRFGLDKEMHWEQVVKIAIEEFLSKEGYLE